MGMHFFEIVQGFFAVLALGLAALVLVAVASIARVVWARIRRGLRAPAWRVQSRARP